MSELDPTQSPVLNDRQPRRLSAVGLVKSYRGRRVVDDVALELSCGEVVGLLGPNGAGEDHDLPHDHRVHPARTGQGDA